MTPSITAEQREAIDLHNGQPVFVVDADRHETFVLLSDHDYERVRSLLENGGDAGAWSDQKDARRCELIDKDIAGTISDEERTELTVLERQANEYYDAVAPPPMEGARQLHQTLLNRRAGHQ
jgi:hypothetical protein